MSKSFLFLFLIFLVACGDTSRKNQWTAEEREKEIGLCYDGAIAGQTDPALLDASKKYCQCIFTKVELYYPTYKEYIKDSDMILSQLESQGSFSSCY